MPCEKLKGKLIAYTDKDLGFVTDVIGEHIYVQTSTTEILKFYYKELGYGNKRIKKVLGKIYGNKCMFCGKEEITIDHIVPRSKHGTIDLRNLQLLCKTCNNLKGSRTIDFRPFKIEDKLKIKQFIFEGNNLCYQV